MLSNTRKTNSIFKQSLSPGKEITIDTALPEDAPNMISGRHKNEASLVLFEALVSKLVKDPNINVRRDPITGEFPMQLEHTAIADTITDTVQSIIEARNQLDALPDLTITMAIIISSILSPNDMMSTELIYDAETDIFGDVKNELLQIVKDYFNEDYEIGDKLQTWLERSLFIEGAMPLAVIPETSIDHVINTNLKVTQESLNTEFKNGKLINHGLLGQPRYQTAPATRRTHSGVSFESLSASINSPYEPTVGTAVLGLSVIDNPNVLKLPKLADKIRQDALDEVYGAFNIGVEEYHKPIFVDGSKRRYDGSDEIYPTRTATMTPVLTIKSLEDLDRKTVGHPAVFELPMESVIPIYSPSDPSKHVGYFVALDENGYPVRIDQNMDQYKMMEQSFNNNVNGNVTSSLISTAGRMGIKDEGMKNQKSFDEMSKLYSRVVEQDLIQRMENGRFHGKDLKIGQATELYKLMFVRALKQLNTQLLFLPEVLMTYIAFDYKPNGTGKSLLDKTKVVGSLRMVETMTSAIANAKSSIDHRVLSINLDPEDPDPMKRVQQYLHEFQRGTKAAFPMGVNSFADITDYLQRAGVQVKITGHEAMPDMSMEVSHERYDYNKPDDQYREELDKKHIMSLGAPPESIRSSEDIEFATSVISSNVLLAKISLQRQLIFSRHLSDHLRKYTRSSQPLITAIKDVIENNRDKLPKIDKRFSSETAALVFANNIKVSLPKPDVAKIQIQLDSLSKYEECLDKALPSFVSTELFGEFNLGEKAGQITDNIVSVLKAHFIRKWLMENNVLPELFDLLNTTKESNENFNFLTNMSLYADTLAPNLREYIINNIKRGKTNDGVIEKAEQALGEEQNDFTSTDSSMDNGDSMDTGDDGSNDMGDMGGFDMDFEDGSEQDGDETSGDDSNFM